MHEIWKKKLQQNILPLNTRDDSWVYVIPFFSLIRNRSIEKESKPTTKLDFPQLGRCQNRAEELV